MKSFLKFLEQIENNTRYRTFALKNEEGKIKDGRSNEIQWSLGEKGHSYYPQENKYVITVSSEYLNNKIEIQLNEDKEDKKLANQLAGEANYKELFSLIPQTIKNADKFILLAAYYLQFSNINALKQDIKDYIKLVQNKKMDYINYNPISKKIDIITNNSEGKITEYIGEQGHINWTQLIHGKNQPKNARYIPNDVDVQNEKPIATSPDGKIKVYKANSSQQCIILGKGQRFCISQPGNTMFQSYRDTKISTFYFVYDDSRADNLSKVVVDANNNGLQLTDVLNTTGTIQNPDNPQQRDNNPNIYMKYLQSKGINTSIFVNAPKTKEENDEQQKLGKNNLDLNWFKSLTPEEKSKYIGRGHRLSDEQFDYLWENKFFSLLEQYAKTGLQLDDNQIDKIASNNDLKKNYIHNRLIAIQHSGGLNGKEFYLLTPEQINKLNDHNISNILSTTKNKDEIAKIIIANKKELLTDKNVHYLLAAVTNKDEIAEIIIANKKELLTDNNFIDLLIFATKPNEIVKALGQEKINKLTDDNVNHLLLYAKNKDEIAKIIIANKKELLTDDNVNYSLKYATNKDEIAKIIIANKKELTDNNFIDLLKYPTKPNEIVKALGQEKINKLTDDNVYYLLATAANQNEITNIIIANKKEILPHQAFSFVVAVSDTAKEQTCRVLAPNLRNLKVENFETGLSIVTRNISSSSKSTYFLLEFIKMLKGFNIDILKNRLQAEQHFQNMMKTAVAKAAPQYGYVGDQGNPFDYSKDSPAIIKDYCPKLTLIPKLILQYCPEIKSTILGENLKLITTFCESTTLHPALQPTGTITKENLKSFKVFLEYLETIIYT